MNLLIRSIAGCAAAAMMTACGGGSTGAPVPAPGANASPTGAQRISLAAGEEQSVALPAAGGFAPVLDVHAGDAPGGAALTIATSLDAPAGAVPIASTTRRTAQTGSTRFLFSVSIVAAQTTTLAHVPALHVTVPDAAADELFYEGFADYPTPSSMHMRTEGPAEQSGTTVRFARSSDPLTLVAGTRYVFTYYGVRTGDVVLGRASGTLTATGPLGMTTARTKVQVDLPPLGVGTGRCVIDPTCGAWLTNVPLVTSDTAYTTQLFDATTPGFQTVTANLSVPGAQIESCASMPASTPGCFFSPSPDFFAPAATLFAPPGGTFAGKTITMIVTDFGAVTFTNVPAQNDTMLSLPLTIRIYGH